MTHHEVFHRTVDVDGLNVFYRESGPSDAPVLLLLHGFPSSSHMYRDLIPELSADYRVIAPDYPGFGFSDAPDRTDFDYTFDGLASVVQRFTDVLGLDRYALYVFDYGAPIGFRLAVENPERITAIISQNGNAYEEGISAGSAPMRTYWAEPTKKNREALRGFLSAETTRMQYLTGASNPALVAPEAYSLDIALLGRPGNDEIQLDLLYDYRTNVERYPEIHEYLRKSRPPLLLVWGEHDPFFLPAGAKAFLRDQPDAELHLFDTGHFALETHHLEIGAAIRHFLGNALG